jgi:hypothetical protein
LNQNYETFNEKLSFYQEILPNLQTKHIEILLNNVDTLQQATQNLVLSSNSRIRLKGLNIIKLIHSVFLLTSPPKNFGLHSLLLSRLILSITKSSLEIFDDPKLQFNVLLVLDEFFQKTMGTPDVLEEFNRKPKKEVETDILDLFKIEPTADFKVKQIYNRYNILLIL